MAITKELNDKILKELFGDSSDDHDDDFMCFERKKSSSETKADKVEIAGVQRSVYERGFYV